MHSAAVLLLLVIALGVQTQLGHSQDCSAQLSSLNVCAPYVLPGVVTPNPSSDCCNALQTVQHDCLCNTLRIAARLPTQCSLPALTCAA
ncbi:hypothetical protein Tsubulata_034564, partial [Turnera subulata]